MNCNILYVPISIENMLPTPITDSMEFDYRTIQAQFANERNHDLYVSHPDLVQSI